MRNALAAVVPEPITGFGNGCLLFLGFRFVVQWRVAQSGADGIDDGFKELHQAGDLYLRQSVNQLVRVLAGIGHVGDSSGIGGTCVR